TKISPRRTWKEASCTPTVAPVRASTSSLGRPDLRSARASFALGPNTLLTERNSTSMIADHLLSFWRCHAANWRRETPPRKREPATEVYFNPRHRFCHAIQ